MNPYVVLYRDEAIMSPADPPFGFTCQADDADHAEEQCLNAYPDVDVVWVVHGLNYGRALEDYYELETV